jgi:hypothetical protein
MVTQSAGNEWTSALAEAMPFAGSDKGRAVTVTNYIAGLDAGAELVMGSSGL